MLTGNKGEWSEIYTLIRLLADGKLYQSDLKLNKDLDNVYEIVKAYKDEKNYKLQFDRNQDITLYKVDLGNQLTFVAKFTILQLENLADQLLNGIKKGKGKAFKIIEVEDFLEREILISRLKARSGSKADIKLRIYDHRLARETDLGFSIKSLLGKNSTLFNTGIGNNFVYKIYGNLPITVPEFNRETYKPVKDSKLKYRLEKLVEYSCDIKYDRIQSRQLWKNLKMVDGDLPSIIAYAIYYRYLYSKSSVAVIADMLERNDPLNFYNGEQSTQKLYENKIKRFLSEAAMGMTSETPWLGEYDSFGGVIIVKKDGDIVCFHIYDFNLFRNYLINNTRFEQPSTGEDESNPGNPGQTGKKYHFGWLYQENNELYIKLNLQVRFK